LVHGYAICYEKDGRVFRKGNWESGMPIDFVGNIKPDNETKK